METVAIIMVFMISQLNLIFSAWGPKAEDDIDSNFIGLKSFSDLYYTVSQKTCDYIFYHNFNSKCPISIIFGIVSIKSICHRKMVSFPTSPI